MLIDNCSAHGPIDGLQSDDGNIIVMHLPPNVTAVVQPMDQNPIKLVKLKYRSLLLSQIIAQKNCAVQDLLKQHTIRDAILMMKIAYDDLAEHVLQKSWSKLMEWDKDEYDMEDLIPLSELQKSDKQQSDQQKSDGPTSPDYDELIKEVESLLLKIAPNTDLTIRDIEGWNTDPIEEGEGIDEPNESDDDNEDDCRAKTNIPYSEAIDHVNGLINWCNRDKENSTQFMGTLIELRTHIVHTQLKKSQKQTTLKEFFKPNAN